MADTVRNQSQLLTIFADNTTQAITPQDMRDFVVTTFDLDDNQGDNITALESTVSGHTSSLSTLSSTVSGHTSSISTNTSDIGTLNTTVSGHTTSLSTLSSTKAPLASPTFTGTPAAPTATAGTNTTQIATTAFVKTANQFMLAVSCLGVH